MNPWDKIGPGRVTLPTLEERIVALEIEVGVLTRELAEARASRDEGERRGAERMRERAAQYVAPFDADTGPLPWGLACVLRSLPLDDGEGAR